MPIVFLSAGHGGNDNGASANGLKEDAINLNMMLECRNVLVRHGVTVLCSRTSDESDPVKEEVKEANESKCDLAFSIHNNAGGGDGYESYTYEGNKNMTRLASIVEKHVKALGQNCRGNKSGNHLYFVKNTTMDAILVEGFFLDNKNDLKIADTIQEQRMFGVAFAKAILEYFNIPYSDTSENISKPSEKDYEAIGRACEECMNDIEGLDSYKKLMSLMG